MTIQTPNTDPVALALDRFITELKAIQPIAPRIAYNPDWNSDCYQQQADSGVSVGWRPALQQQPHDMFERLSHALEEPIHEDIIHYYSRYWSDPLPANRNGDTLSLIQVWNPDDLERLRENLIGHALAKQRSKLPLTLFFACVTPDSDYFISVLNQTGEVVLETPGRPVIRTLAASLPAFLDSLSPVPVPDQE